MAPAAPWAVDRLLDSRVAFQAAVRDLLLQAAARGVRRMAWVSADWADWPIGEPAVVDALTDWAKSGRVQMDWLAQDYRAFQGPLARLMRWRRDWSHCVRCLTPADAEPTEWRSVLIIDDVLVLEWSNSVHARGRISTVVGDIHRAQQWVDAVLQRSTETLPVTTLGL